MWFVFYRTTRSLSSSLAWFLKRFGGFKTVNHSSKLLHIFIEDFVIILILLKIFLEIVLKAAI